MEAGSAARLQETGAQKGERDERSAREERDRPGQPGFAKEARGQRGGHQAARAPSHGVAGRRSPVGDDGDEERCDRQDEREDDALADEGTAEVESPGSFGRKEEGRADHADEAGPAG